MIFKADAEFVSHTIYVYRTVFISARPCPALLVSLWPKKEKNDISPI